MRTCGSSKRTRHLFIQLVYKPLYCLVNVILPFAVSDPDVSFPLIPPLFVFAPPNPLEVTTISTRVIQSSILVLCWFHRLSVFISSRSAFSWSWLFGAGIVGGVVLV